jgi:histidyl-tRNA synthetase
MKIKAIRGTKDILPQESGLWCFVEQQAKNLCRNYGYKEIRTPLLEEAHLFSRSIGATSDIVRKEMYSFLDRKKRLLCLRPEATASVVRAYLEHNLDKDLRLAKFYYFGPMFRAERPQAGRLRQFHHIGVEAIGSSSPYLDAEVISLAVKILQGLGVKNFTLQLNSIGCAEDRERHRVELRRALRGKLKGLCSDCQARYKTNLLRIFDCKNPACKKITRWLPGTDACLCDECNEHYGQVKQAIDSLDISYIPSPHLVRGLDYYTKTCFEITHPNLGAQDALGAGGRYDELVKELGGPDKPAIGFALGVERLIAVLEPTDLQLTDKTQPSLYFAAIGEESKEEAFKRLYSLRKKGISCEMDYLDKSLKGQMRQADKLGARFVAILGEEELKKDVIILRDMQNKTQKEIKIDKLDEALR